MKKEIFVVLSAVFALMIIGVVSFVSAWAGEVNFDFDEGWNLVYGFMSPDQLDGQVLEKQNIKAIYALIPTTQKYARLYPDMEKDAFNSIDDDEVSQMAMWVYTEKGALSEYWLDNVPNPFTERQIYKGWNFIGITPDMVSQSPLEDIKGSCNIEKSYFFVNEFQEWREYPLTNKFDDNHFVGFGWAIKVSDDCRLGSSSSGITSPPGLPGDSYVLDYCLVSAPFGCDEYAISTTGINLVIRNGMGDSVDINSVAVSGCAADTIVGTVADGATITVTPTCALTLGGKFKGDIIINYKKTGGSIVQQAPGSISGKVV